MTSSALSCQCSLACLTIQPLLMAISPTCPQPDPDPRLDPLKRSWRHPNKVNEGRGGVESRQGSFTRLVSVSAGAQLSLA
ncbi:hypothetical protein BKA60DRAFT_566327 [Fusarium oxysporum]|nr:hypothetical protein BKA60DRAFT_566327 [Fusarium oxysporum]